MRQWNGSRGVRSPFAGAATYASGLGTIASAADATFQRTAARITEFVGAEVVKISLLEASENSPRQGIVGLPRHVAPALSLC